MVVEIISIVLSSLLSLIAVIISIISIKKQTNSQNINSTIALFDKRFEIYNFVIEAWFVVGYFDGALNFLTNKKHYFKDILKIVNNTNISKDVDSKIKKLYINSKRFEDMQELLFSGDISEYLQTFLSNFSTYIDRIYKKESLDKDEEESAYQELMLLLETKELDMKELKKFLDLSDVKRLDV